MTVLSVHTSLSEEQFMERIKGPLEQSIPPIQLEYAPCREQADLYLLPPNDLAVRFEHGELMDYRQLTHSKTWNWERFEPHLLAWGQDETTGALYALPYNNANEFPLFYNKTILDKLDFPYPSDNMSWEELIELAERVTAAVDGHLVYGLDPADFALMRMQLAVSYLDAKTGLPNLLHPDWLTLTRTIKSIYSIEGNMFPDTKHLLRFNGYFVRQQSVAMGVICVSCFAPEDLQFDWDMVSYPIYGEGPAWSPNVPGLAIAIHADCPEPEAALEAVCYLISIISREWRAAASDHPSLVQRFMLNSEWTTRFIMEKI